MLYKHDEHLSDELFRNPTSEYRATPFWAWNNKLNADELTWQIGEFKKLGFGGFHMHVRTGMATAYLSDEYISMVRACVEKARASGMLAWLYDEDRWPSGAAGGIVTKNPEHRIRHLLLTRTPYGEGGAAGADIRSKAGGSRTENGSLIACFDIELAADGSLVSYCRVFTEGVAADAANAGDVNTEHAVVANAKGDGVYTGRAGAVYAGSNSIAKDTNAGNNTTAKDTIAGSNSIAIDESASAAGDFASKFRLYAYEETALPSPWFNNQTYADTLNPSTIREFIKVTYERYAGTFAADFGGVIPAIFTDEPQFSQKSALAFAHEARDVTLPWTSDIPETYKNQYGGEDIVGCLPELLWDLPDGRISTARYHYHDHITERFTSAFADQCGEWCEKNGIMLTGHLMEEPTLQSQTHALGEAMRSYRSFQLPGIDMLCDRREFTTAKQAQSAARQYGRPGVLCEIYGVTNWDFDFRGHKLQGDWQAALGVTVRVPHLSWVSMNGEAKRDYPGTFNYQAPWYKEYPYIEDHFARVNTALTRGKAICRVGVVHPIESYWLHWGARENTQAIRQQMDERFSSLCDWLLRGLIDFDYICESLLPEQCDTAAITSGAFPVGMMRYETVIVPPMETIRQTTIERLEVFKNAGGRVIFLGDAPLYMDAAVNDGPRKLWERCEKHPFERLQIILALDEVRDLDIRDRSGSMTDSYLYQLRADGDCRWLFVAHADNPANKDLPGGAGLRIRIKGEWLIDEYNTITGDITPLRTAGRSGWTIVEMPFFDHDSLLVKLTRPQINASETSVSAKPAKATELMESVPVATSIRYTGRELSGAVTRFLAPVPATLHEPNVMLLDIAEYALDGEPLRPREEILRLDNILRRELGWPSRGEAFAQPWVETDASTPRVLRLRYMINSEVAVSGAELALENAYIAKVELNGRAASAPIGWYVDKSIGRVRLGDIKPGKNTLEITLPYGRKTDVEAAYLLGDFGVKVQGSNIVLAAPVTALCFGDITGQGLPFYGGNLTYHLEAESRGGSMVIAAGYWRGHLLRVIVDGRDRGVIAYSPYRLVVDGLADGAHNVDIVCFGCRINTFGQVHNTIRTPGYWWGPNSWRTEGAAWTYEYKLWEQGVLKSPEILCDS